MQFREGDKIRATHGDGEYYQEGDYAILIRCQGGINPFWKADFTGNRAVKSDGIWSIPERDMHLIASVNGEPIVHNTKRKIVIRGRNASG